MNARPTTVRYQIIGVSMLMAFILYLDRACLGEIVKSESFRGTVKITSEEIGSVLGAFFFAYALAQVPAGWAADRFGARRMLTIYIVLWSSFTALTGTMVGFLGLMIARLGCGVSEAGAYPTSGAVIRRWFRSEDRGGASALVSFGGRIGGALAPWLTALMILGFGSWRAALWFDGLMGLVIAGLYWWIVRDRPSEHPGCNTAEREWISQPREEPPPTLNEFLPLLGACIISRSLWLNSLVLFFVNVGWTFLLAWLPSYLTHEKRVPEMQGAMMVSFVLSCGIVGQLIGGAASLLSVRRLGLRWGRIAPLAISSLIAGLAYYSCALLDSVWGLVACCAVVALMTDIGNPSSWAFIQDVGGRNTAAIFGWSNMWGNFGASLSAVMVPRLLKMGGESDWGEQLVFIACGSAFFIASLLSLGIDATRPVVHDEKPG